MISLATLGACRSTDLSRRDAMGLTDSLGEAEVRAHSAYVMDFATGRTLLAEDADALRYPASLTKMMTLYLLFEAIEQRRLSLDTPLVVSQNAASKPPSKLGLAPGSTIAARDAAQALAVKSANDIATVIAENLGETEAAFALAMTRKAQALGMRRTRFVNASGLPDPRQVSTARDMTILGRALRGRFPQYAPLFAAREFAYAGRTHRATNKLLGTVPGVDGLKTGFIRDAGFNLVATAERGGRRILVTVIGGRTGAERNAEVAALVDRFLGPAPLAPMPADLVAAGLE